MDMGEDIGDAFAVSLVAYLLYSLNSDFFFLDLHLTSYTDYSIVTLLDT